MASPALCTITLKAKRFTIALASGIQSGVRIAPVFCWFNIEPIAGWSHFAPSVVYWNLAAATPRGYETTTTKLKIETNNLVKYVSDARGFGKVDGDTFPIRNRIWCLALQSWGTEKMVGTAGRRIVLFKGWLYLLSTWKQLRFDWRITLI